ncbi:MAG: DUF1207 domain-containing protein [Elusimicrobia bacterium]|nr:DUF1207 domain-containing protein [Elusimicrobiota bacterium]MDE2238275.1 DUF1207 domain-containing protein [Elusimicrobiota bacterium]MDE2424309.1 DUF1207 domain-containing protein [Elusimicrobiota bacterium]
MTSRRLPAAKSLSKALLLALLAMPALAAGDHAFGLFPESEQVFRQLTADPRHIRLGASYYRLDGHNEADVALGHSWGMASWRDEKGRWLWQSNIEAMAYSRFLVGGGVNQFETVDFFANLPLSARRGPFSARGMLFHESSHLGDDYIRSTGSTGFRYSIEGARATVSYEPSAWSRLYCGVSYLLHSIPLPQRKAAQWGFELTSRQFGLSAQYPLHIYLAQDFQSNEDVRYNVNSNTEAGLVVGFKDVQRFMRVFLAYFDGHSSYGQFFSRREHYVSVGLALHI